MEGEIQTPLSPSEAYDRIRGGSEPIWSRFDLADGIEAAPLAPSSLFQQFGNYRPSAIVLSKRTKTGLQLRKPYQYDFQFRPVLHLVFEGAGGSTTIRYRSRPEVRAFGHAAASSGFAVFLLVLFIGAPASRGWGPWSWLPPLLVLAAWGGAALVALRTLESHQEDLLRFVKRELDPKLKGVVQLVVDGD
jgi:hypothetical protein